MSKTLTGLPYYGGKQKGKAEWIGSLLPWKQDTTYVEPFCGMAGVLLARAPVNLEILNDRNDRIINWWRAVRDEPEEFAYLIENTPYSRAEYDRAWENLDNEELTALQRALAFHIVVEQGLSKGDGYSSWGAG